MGASAVMMTVRWQVPLGQSRRVAEALHQVMVAARSRPGCLRCSVATDVGKDVGVRYSEEWADEDLLRREVRSDRFTTLAALMESATAFPIVEFHLPEGIRGLDYVEDVRASRFR